MAKGNVSARKAERGVDDYGYINARIRAMRSELLTKADLERLAQADDLDVLNLLLAGFEYGEDIKASEQKFAKGVTKLDTMEDGLKQNFIRTVDKICNFLGGKPAELVGIILGRWDIFNLKTIIRGKHLNLQPAEIIQSLFFVGSLNRDYWEWLAHRESLDDIFNALAKVFPKVTSGVKGEIEKLTATEDLAELELVLEKCFYENALNLSSHMGEAGRLVRKFLQAEIDIVNAITCLRLSRLSDIKPDEALQFYIPGGTKIRPVDFTGLIAMGDIEKILAWLEGIPTFKKGMRKNLELFKNSDDISIFERLFEANLIYSAKELATGDPFKFTILMSYLKLKYNELVNLRIILRAVGFGIPKEMVKQGLVFV